MAYGGPPAPKSALVMPPQRPASHAQPAPITRGGPRRTRVYRPYEATKAPRRPMPTARGRLTSSVRPSAVPTRIIGTRRRHSSRAALRGFSRPTLNAVERSTSANSGSANCNGTKWVASGMVTSAEPKPVMPTTSAPMKASPASSAASGAMNDECLRRAAVHGAQLRHVAGERQLVARFELLGTRTQRGPRDARRRPAESEREDVRVVERGHREDRAAEGALEALQVEVELRIVVHEVDDQHAGFAQREERPIVEFARGELRHVELVLERIDHQEVAALRRQRLGPVADLDRKALVVGRQRELGACCS